MPRRKLGTLLPLELSILDSGIGLQSAEGSFYGFALARSLSESEGSPLTAHGTLYKALSRMTTSGMLEAVWEDAAIAETEGRPRRRLYRVTAEGQRAHSAAVAAARVAAPARVASEGAFFA